LLVAGAGLFGGCGTATGGRLEEETEVEEVAWEVEEAVGSEEDEEGAY